MRERETIMQVESVERRMTQEVSGVRANLAHTQHRLHAEIAGLHREMAKMQAEMRAHEASVTRAVQDIWYRQKLREDAAESRQRMDAYRRDIIWCWFVLTVANMITLGSIIVVMLR